MSIAIKLSEELVREARCYGEAFSRSVPKQVEYWARIGKIAEENQDLTFDFIKSILIAQQEAREGATTPYHFGA